MKKSIFLPFALKNLKANQKTIIPFVLSSSLMIALSFVMASLVANDFVQQRHITLPFVIGLGSFISFLFTTIFVFYANRFLLRQRNKEFALYSILGLERKHIRRILFWEILVLWLAINFLTIIGGYLLGKLSFLSLAYLMKDFSMGMEEYPFYIGFVLLALVYNTLLFLVLYGYNTLNLQATHPISLLKKIHKAEGEPKSRIYLTIFGFIFLIIGYSIALTTKGALESIFYFFLAAFLVIIASYFLFMSFSIVLLKRLKKRKSYYKTENFLSVSGMLYRMKSHAISLASISVLVATAIISLSASITIYQQIETSASRLLSRQYSVSYSMENNSENYATSKEKLYETIHKNLPLSAKLSNDYFEISSSVPAHYEDGKILSFSSNKSSFSEYLLFSTQEAYQGQLLTRPLEKNEILVARNNNDLPLASTLRIADKEYRVIPIENTLPSNIAISAYGIYFANEEVLQEILPYYTFDYKGAKQEPIIYISYNYDLQGISNQEYLEHMKGVYRVESLEEYRLGLYELNGGFVFLGIMITLLFFTGTILLMYYKQISEANEDREAYRIMRNIGLDYSMIHKSCKQKILFIFFLPLLVAILHSFVASRILYKMLLLFGVNTYFEYLPFLMIITSFFAILYYVLFKITSNIYYKTVA